MLIRGTRRVERAVISAIRLIERIDGQFEFIEEYEYMLGTCTGDMSARTYGLYLAFTKTPSSSKDRLNQCWGLHKSLMGIIWPGWSKDSELSTKDAHGERRS